MGKIGQKLRIPNREFLNYIDNYIEYEPDTGKIWKFYPTTDSYRLINGTNSEGYIRVYLCKEECLGHYVAWYLFYGKWPTKEIDHKNRIRTDNIIDNLREVNDEQQTANLSTQSKYGRCIWYKKRINKYEVCIRKNNERKYVGVFKTLEEAIIARDNADGINKQLELPL